MIRTLIASTGEIDDIESAVQQITSQLDLENQLLRHSVGIISCHYEFIHSGAMAAICQALPFDVAGAVTMNHATNRNLDTFLLTIMVLTSDDISFSTALTEPLHGQLPQRLETAYQALTSGREDAPALLLVYAPFMSENSGDDYVNILTEVSGGVPCFGTMAIDDSDTNTFDDCLSIYNGEHYSDRICLISMHGSLRPRFFLATISPDKIFAKPALITKSTGHILQEVNGRPVMEYFSNLGLTTASEKQYAMASLPFMLNYEDGTPPVSKVFIALTEENYALCAGAMPEGASLYIGMFDKEDVLFTSGQAVDKALEDLQDASAMLIYSCISRSMSLGGGSLEELALIQEKVGARIPLLMAYSGGEMCPTQLSNDKAINRFHNNTFIGCIF